jgi:hypothetical protein
MKKIYQVVWLGDSPSSGKVIMWHNEHVSQHFSRKEAKKAAKKLLRQYKDESHDFSIMIREVWKR